ncbi:MAG: serine hydrolase domain-containing protein [Gemmatimonadota bacterium]|nr:serine hydrolase domain-containing protein [Gemmatimonadota bacterium]
MPRTRAGAGWVTAIALLLLSSRPLAGATPVWMSATAQETEPGPGVLSPGSPAATRVDSVFTVYDRTDSPGCALGVMRAGELLYARGYGMANLELREALGPASVFRIGSVSKQFTAATVVRAEQGGFLSLDDDIREHLPEMPEYQRPVTIRMLLHHTSGIRDYLALMSLAGLRSDDWYSIDEAYRMVARQRETNFVPGDEHLYSNAGYFLLSQIIERATGSSLREFADEHLFRPLGMRHTHFHDDHTHVVPERASGYAPTPDGFRISMTTLDMVGDGGIYTTIEDLARWDANFYEPTVGGRAFLDAMLTRGALANGDTIDYALGLVHDEYRGLARVQHGGAFVGFRAQMIRFPDQRLSVAVLCNLSTTNPTALAEDVADVALEDVFVAEPRVAGAPATAAARAPDAPASVELTVEQLERWAGLYTDGSGYMRLEMRAGLLTAAVGAGFTLHPSAEDHFHLEEVPVTFDFREEGGIRRYTLTDPNGTAEYESVEEAALTAASAAAYAGRYHATELGVDYVLTAEGASVRVQRGRQDPRELTPTVADEFTLGGATLRFERDGGRPIAFVIDAGRVRGIRFERISGD